MTPDGPGPEPGRGSKGPGSARGVARGVLWRVRRDAAYANLALSGAFRRARTLSPADRGLCTELVYGVLRHQRLLDHALSRHARQPLERLDPEVLDTLRMAAYQLLFLERVPAYAAVDDAVEAVRQARGPRPAGFANAVLRKLGPEDLRAGWPAEPVAALALECSLPEPLAQLWVAQLGLEPARQLGLQLLRRSPLTARLNTLKVDGPALIEQLTGEGARAQAGRWSPEALQLSGAPEPFLTRSYLDGLWTAQDEAAQLVGHLLDPQPGERVLDACAGVGGKSTHLAALMRGQGEVLALDISARKLERLREHCLRLGVTIATPLEADLREAEALPVDRVLVDAPCTGLGVLGRHPELKWRLALDRIDQLVGLQRELLEAALRWLRPGGRLVYSVCTTTEEEGPRQLRWLLDRHPELALDPAPDQLLELAPESELRLWPHRHGTDGFYAARLRSRSGSGSLEGDASCGGERRPADGDRGSA